MQVQGRTVVQMMFTKYYEKFSRIIYVERIDAREIGIVPFSGSMSRHMWFKEISSFRKFLREETPLHCYYSVAYYRDPSARMGEKGWIGADLVFDIDADHINAPCRPEHTPWRCKSCKEEGTKEVEACPVCGGEVDSRKWFCSSCIKAAAKEAVKVIDVLREDFGVDDIRVSFSGNRGFHIRAVSDEILQLGGHERREIGAYVMGEGVEIFGKRGIIQHIRNVRGGAWVRMPTVRDGGWKRRIAEYLLRAIEEGEIFHGVGEELKRNLKLALSGEAKPHMLVGTKALRRIIKLAERGLAELGGKIDIVVTEDIHRLIRVVNSLHGGTGFRVVPLLEAEVASFDPFSQAVVPFNEAVRIVVQYPVPRFQLLKKSYGPYHSGEEVELPTHAAVYLILRGMAVEKRESIE
ncbi:MAG: hypothetical protein DRN99_07150 [Thermoproteota archaeon]|nr:MAG: hypothetical protein DRN99_07150 [Candidatus Korarchaeota archaeon]